jgi:hypothetical protein
MIGTIELYYIMWIAKIVMIGFFVTRFHPITIVFDALEDTSQKVADSLWWLIFRTILECSKCFTFWFGWVISGSIMIGIASSVVTMVVEKTIGKWLDQEKLN